MRAEIQLTIPWSCCDCYIQQSLSPYPSSPLTPDSEEGFIMNIREEGRSTRVRNRPKPQPAKKTRVNAQRYGTAIYKYTCLCRFLCFTLLANSQLYQVIKACIDVQPSSEYGFHLKIPCHSFWNFMFSLEGKGTNAAGGNNVWTKIG